MTNYYNFVLLKHQRPSQPQGPLGFCFMQTILFVDGRNFLSKANFIISQQGEKNTDFSTYNFRGLFDKVLSGIVRDKEIFYFGRLLKHPETLEKSKKLIEKQRKLKDHLETQGFEVIFAGRVRGHIEKCSQGHTNLTFKEKGVDVKLAVDMLNLASKKELKTAIIGSSDSDLQPVVKALEEIGVERIYFGFENNLNKGLTFTTNRTILIRNSEILEFKNSQEGVIDFTKIQKGGIDINDLLKRL